MGKDYKDIATVCRNFLDTHPSETIVMSVKDKSDVDSNSDKFAPSQVLRKWPRGDVVNRSNTPSFEETLKAKPTNTPTRLRCSITSPSAVLAGIQ
jgi:hypothetical protein